MAQGRRLTGPERIRKEKLVAFIEVTVKYRPDIMNKEIAYMLIDKGLPSTFNKKWKLSGAYSFVNKERSILRQQNKEL